MISEATLASALARGVITPDQLDRLRAMEDARADAGALEPPDEERLRFLTGFGDIFVTIGIVLFFSGFLMLDMAARLPGLGFWVLIAAIAWGLAEYFTRRRRMALPSIVLLLVFCCAAAKAALWAGIILGFPLESFRAVVPRGPAAMLAGGAAAVAAALHYRRFHVPATPAVGAAALVYVVVTVAMTLAPGAADAVLNWLLLAAGLVIFVLAMAIDARDPLRVTRNTDIAFWLHLLAAPLIVQTVMSGLWQGSTSDAAAAVMTLAVFLVLAVVALLVNRRAIVVSGLLYAYLAFGVLTMAPRGSSSGPMKILFFSIPNALAFLVLGGFILLLSAGWQRLRGLVLGILPAGLARFLPPLTVAAT